MVNQSNVIFFENSANGRWRRECLIVTIDFDTEDPTDFHTLPSFFLRLAWTAGGDDDYPITTARQLLTNSLSMNADARESRKKIITNHANIWRALAHLAPLPFFN